MEGVLALDFKAIEGGTSSFLEEPLESPFHRLYEGEFDSKVTIANMSESLRDKSNVVTGQGLRGLP